MWWFYTKKKYFPFMCGLLNYWSCKTLCTNAEVKICEVATENHKKLFEMLKKKKCANTHHTHMHKHTHLQTHSHKHIQKYFMEKDVGSMVLLCLNFIAIYLFVSLAFFLVIMQDISTVCFIEVWLLPLIIPCHILSRYFILLPDILHIDTVQRV